MYLVSLWIISNIHGTVTKNTDCCFESKFRTTVCGSNKELFEVEILLTIFGVAGSVNGSLKPLYRGYSKLNLKKMSTNK